MKFTPTKLPEVIIVEPDVHQDDRGFFLESYQESLVRLPGAMRTALETGDGEAMARAAHALKSNSAAAGALELSALCADIEKQAREDGAEGAGARIVEVENDSFPDTCPRNNINVFTACMVVLKLNFLLAIAVFFAAVNMVAISILYAKK